jgi:hypothetical protein
MSLLKFSSAASLSNPLIPLPALPGGGPEYPRGQSDARSEGGLTRPGAAAKQDTGWLSGNV